MFNFTYPEETESKNKIKCIEDFLNANKGIIQKVEKHVNEKLQEAAAEGFAQITQDELCGVNDECINCNAIAKEISTEQPSTEQPSIKVVAEDVVEYFFENIKKDINNSEYNAELCKTNDLDHNKVLNITKS